MCNFVAGSAYKAVAATNSLTINTFAYPGFGLSRIRCCLPTASPGYAVALR